MLLNGQILIIDDEQKLRSLLNRIISLEGYSVAEAHDLLSAKKILQRQQVDVIICDVRLPHGSGVEFVKYIKMHYPAIEMILFTAFVDIAVGIQAMKNGAFDYVIKGNDNDKIIPLLGKAIEKVRLQKRLSKLEKEIKMAYGFENIIGRSPLVTLNKRLAEGLDFAAKVGCDIDPDPAACLRNLPAAELVSAVDTTSIVNGIVHMPFGPTVDGTLVTQEPMSALQAGSFNHTPFVIGTNADEMLPSVPDMTQPAYVAAVHAMLDPFGAGYASQALNLYPVGPG